MERNENNAWKEWEETLELEKNENGWLANTPHGRRGVKPTFINGIPSIYYAEGEKTFATHVPTLDPQEITRGRIVRKRLHGVFFDVIAGQEKVIFEK